MLSNNKDDAFKEYFLLRENKAKSQKFIFNELASGSEMKIPNVSLRYKVSNYKVHYYYNPKPTINQYFK